MESKENIMKRIVMVGLAVVVLGAGVLISLQRTQGSSQQQGQMAALKALRDSGVITAQEFDSKLQALQAKSAATSGVSRDKIAALERLRKTGVITAQEYDSKVQALQASAPAASAASATSPASPA